MNRIIEYMNSNSLSKFGNAKLAELGKNLEKILVFHGDAGRGLHQAVVAQ